MLIITGRNRQNIRIEDDIRRIETDLVDKQTIRALTDLKLPVGLGGLAVLIERHDHHGRAVLVHDASLLQKVRLALLQTNTIRDAFALEDLEAGLDHGKVRRIDTNGHARHVRLTRQQVEELGHASHGVQHALVEVDVQDLRAILHLILGHLERRVVLVLLDELEELARAGHVAALADVDKVGVLADAEGLQARQDRVALVDGGGRLARFDVGDGPGDRANVCGRGAAAAAHHVDEAVTSKAQHVLRHGLGRLVVLAERVRQARVRVARHVSGRVVADRFDERTHLLRAQRTVQSHSL